MLSLHDSYQHVQVLPERESRVIISQVCSGLAYLNEPPRRIIHYDLKPANIMFDSYGQVKLTVGSWLAHASNAKLTCMVACPQLDCWGAQFEM